MINITSDVFMRSIRACLSAICYDMLLVLKYPYIFETIHS